MQSGTMPSLFSSIVSIAGVDVAPSLQPFPSSQYVSMRGRCFDFNNVNLEMHYNIHNFFSKYVLILLKKADSLVSNLLVSQTNHDIQFGNLRSNPTKVWCQHLCEFWKVFPLNLSEMQHLQHFQTFDTQKIIDDDKLLRLSTQRKSKFQ